MLGMTKQVMRVYFCVTASQNFKFPLVNFNKSVHVMHGPKVRYDKTIYTRYFCVTTSQNFFPVLSFNKSVHVAHGS